MEETKRAETRSALRASEGRFRAMFEGSPIGTALLDLEARYVDVNRSLEAMLGYTAAEILGSYVWEHYPDKSSETPMAYLAKLLNGSANSYRREQRFVRKDGKEIFAQVTAALLRDEFGTPEFGLCMVEDITERRLLEGQLRQAQKMEAVGRFAGGIAHDFNNTLSTISAYAQILLDDLEENDCRRSDASEILKAASRAAGLTRQLLTFSRKKAVRYELLDICAVVREFGSLLRPLLPASIHLVTHAADQRLTVRTDRTQLEQVLMNLALNARDAMPNGGTLTIEVGQRGEALPVDALDALEPRDARVATLSVSDTGIGVSDELRAKIFEPFFTTKAESCGTGLGLATVYAIVRQNGGTINLDTTPGEGSRFTVMLPTASEQTESSCGAEAGVSPEACDARTTVLIAEDEPSVREVARRLLQRTGVRVLTADDGREALSIIRNDQHIDVLMTDITMPLMSGAELIEQVALLGRDIRVIVMSGHSEVGASDPRVICDMVLEKPFSADSLVNAVRTVTATASRVGSTSVA